jgi:hypothetical protein
VASTVNKLPLLGDLPIIGSFFRNLDYKRQDKELVIIVTPRLVKPLARNTELPLPGEREARANLPVWGSWLIGPAGALLSMFLTLLVVTVLDSYEETRWLAEAMVGPAGD